MGGKSSKPDDSPNENYARGPARTDTKDSTPNAHVPLWESAISDFEHIQTASTVNDYIHVSKLTTSHEKTPCHKTSDQSVHRAISSVYNPTCVSQQDLQLTQTNMPVCSTDVISASGLTKDTITDRRIHQTRHEHNKSDEKLPAAKSSYVKQFSSPGAGTTPQHRTNDLDSKMPYVGNPEVTTRHHSRHPENIVVHPKPEVHVQPTIIKRTVIDSSIDKPNPMCGMLGEESIKIHHPPGYDNRASELMLDQDSKQMKTRYVVDSQTNKWKRIEKEMKMSEVSTPIELSSYERSKCDIKTMNNYINQMETRTRFSEDLASLDIRRWEVESRPMVTQPHYRQADSIQRETDKVRSKSTTEPTTNGMERHIPDVPLDTSITQSCSESTSLSVPYTRTNVMLHTEDVCIPKSTSDSTPQIVNDSICNVVNSTLKVNQIMKCTDSSSITDSTPKSSNTQVGGARPKIKPAIQKISVNDNSTLKVNQMMKCTDSSSITDSTPKSSNTQVGGARPKIKPAIQKISVNDNSTLKVNQIMKCTDSSSITDSTPKSSDTQVGGARPKIKPAIQKISVSDNAVVSTCVVNGSGAGGVDMNYHLRDTCDPYVASRYAHKPTTEPVKSIDDMATSSTTQFLNVSLPGLSEASELNVISSDVPASQLKPTTFVSSKELSSSGESSMDIMIKEAVRVQTELLKQPSRTKQSSEDHPELSDTSNTVLSNNKIHDNTHPPPNQSTQLPSGRYLPNRKSLSKPKKTSPKVKSCSTSGRKLPLPINRERSISNTTQLESLIRNEICKTLLSVKIDIQGHIHKTRVSCSSRIDEITLQSIIERTLSYPIKLTSFDDSQKKVDAVLEFQSKRKMNQALQQLKQLNDMGLTFQAISNQMELQDVKTQISKEVDIFMKKAQKPLSDHNSKIKTLEMKIKKLNEKPCGIAAFDELQALLDKVSEMSGQKREFVQFRELLREKYNVLGMPPVDPDKDYNREMSAMKVQFGLELLKFSTALPMYSRRSEIIQCVRSNTVNVILGETGSGKSTQMTQYLVHEEFTSHGLIVCTQPRKVAAMSLAQHVSREMGSPVGGLVGYKVGGNCKKTKLTRIMYVTDHTLLNECIADPHLSQYSCIIIDEAHERSIYTDLLLGMIKKTLQERNDLRVIITSATIDPEIFIEFFDGCPMLKVSGRAFPVDVHYQRTPQTDISTGNDNANPPPKYEEMAVDKALEIHKNLPPGDILVFLTSPIETEKASELCRRRYPFDNLVCLQLHGQQQSSEQQKVFEKAHKEQRKVVFATNCAETSITIPGIKYVVDTGLSKEKHFDATKSMSTLTVCYISKSSADQRKGRAGRTESGQCFRLYSEDTYDNMRTISTPEILRAHLGQSLLKLMVLGIRDPMQFDFVQSPPEDALVMAHKNLIDLGAIDDDGLTDLGRKLANLSLEPKLGKLVIDGIHKGIGMEVIIIAAVAGVGFNIFFRGKTKEDQDKSERRKITRSQNRGDIFTAVSVFKEWHSVPEKQKNAWCMENSLNAKSMRITRDNASELQRILAKDLHIKVKYEAADDDTIDTALPPIIATCFASNICYFLGHRRIGYTPINNVGQMHPIHPSSTLSCLRSEPKWIVYEQILHTSQQFLINVTCLTDDEVMHVIQQQGIAVDLEALALKKVTQKPVPGIGPFVLRQLIWKTYKKPRNLEEHLMHLTGESCNLALDLEKDNLFLYTQPQKHDDISKFVQEEVLPMKNQLRQTCHEYEIIENGHVRSLLMTGGVLKTVLMPQNSRTITIRRTPAGTSEDDVRSFFTQFGDIEDFFQAIVPANKKKHNDMFWGKVTYLDYRSTAAVTESLKEENRGYEISTNTSKGNQKSDRIQVKLSWCRRKLRGFGFAVFEDPSAAAIEAARVHSVHVDNSIIQVSLNNKNISELYLTRIPGDANTEDIIDALRHEGVDATDLRLIRTNGFATSNQDVEMFERQCKRQLDDCIAPDTYELIIFKPKNDKDFTMNGRVTLSNTEDASAVVHAAMYIHNDGNNARVNASLVLQMTEFVPKQVYTLLHKELTDTLSRLNDPSTVIDAQKLENGCFRIRITVSSLPELQRCRANISRVLAPTQIQTEDRDKCRLLTSATGKHFLETVMRQQKVHVQFDRWRGVLLLYGQPNNRDHAARVVEKFMVESGEYEIHQVHLTGEGKPAGVLRELFIRYQVNLAGFIEECGLFDVQVDVRNHVLRVQGDKNALDKAVTTLVDIMTELSGRDTLDEPDEYVCPVCMCAPDQNTYKMEYCGHIYCQSCVDGMLHHAITSKELPLVCATDGCGEPLIMQDFYNLLGKSRSSLEPLARAATDLFVLQNKHYRYCITPDCPVVYRITSKKHLFECPNTSCHAKICTSCNDAYHEGFSCARHKGIMQDPDFDIKAWVKQSPETRAPCPKCGLHLEKAGGCMHMKCRCGAHICWRCKKTFNTDQDTYDHLGRCGGIFAHDARY